MNIHFLFQNELKNIFTALFRINWVDIANKHLAWSFWIHRMKCIHLISIYTSFIPSCFFFLLILRFYKFTRRTKSLTEFLLFLNIFAVCLCVCYHMFFLRFYTNLPSAHAIERDANIQWVYVFCLFVMRCAISSYQLTHRLFGLVNWCTSTHNKKNVRSLSKRLCFFF